MGLRKLAVMTMAMTLLWAMLVPGTAAAATVEVGVLDFEFEPFNVEVEPGDTVNWVWDGQAPHNVIADDESFASETQTEGEFSQTFEEPGEIGYFCSIHGAPGQGMHGTVFVGTDAPAAPTRGPSQAPTDPGGDDNVNDALFWSSAFADDSAPTVLLGRDDLFADSLASGGVQGLLDAPLLLSPPDELDPRVAAELERLGAETVVLFGGEIAMSSGVEDDLAEAGYETARVAGETRIETAIEVAQTYFETATAAILARSTATSADPTQEFADSLAAGMFAAVRNVPVLLSETDGLSGATRDYLEGSDIETVTLAGGTAALSQQVEDDLVAMEIEVDRAAGLNRFGTALEVTLRALPEGPIFEDAPIIVTEGQAEDAWAAGFAAASQETGLVLSNFAGLPPETVNLLYLATGLGPTLCSVNVVPDACDDAGVVATRAQFGEPGLSTAALAGDEEVPGPGFDTTGDALISTTDDPTVLCYELFEYGLDEPPAAAHIHAGAAGVAGPVVVPLSVAVRTFGFFAGCTFDVDPELVADIQANPRDYYVNVHTASFPDGAIRGQLFPPSFFRLAELTGAAEVPGPGETEGGGFAVVIGSDDPAEICYFYEFGLPEPLEAAHIHEGAPDEAGPIVHPLQLPRPEGSTEITACDQGVDEALVADIRDNPGDYYVNLHTATFPDGAIRGQLFDPTAGPPAKARFDRRATGW